MRVGEIIEHVDMVEPNQYDAKLKIAWLFDFDLKFHEQVVSTHSEPECGEDWEPPRELNDVLLIPEPYARDVYTPYLRMKIAAANMEDTRYNQHAILFNAAYAEYVRTYSRTHMHLRPGVGNRFRF